MAQKIIWTPQAEKTFEAIIDYLQKNWSNREVEKFMTRTNKVIALISSHPEMYRGSNKVNIHEALITKHNLLIYSIRKDRIDLISFWDTRQNPRRKSRLLR